MLPVSVVQVLVCGIMDLDHRGSTEVFDLLNQCWFLLCEMSREEIYWLSCRPSRQNSLITLIVLTLWDTSVAGILIIDYRCWYVAVRFKHCWCWWWFLKHRRTLLQTASLWCLISKPPYIRKTKNWNSQHWTNMSGGGALIFSATVWCQTDGALPVCCKRDLLHRMMSAFNREDVSHDLLNFIQTSNWTTFLLSE